MVRKDLQRQIEGFYSFPDDVKPYFTWNIFHFFFFLFGPGISVVLSFEQSSFKKTINTHSYLMEVNFEMKLG